MKNDFLKTSSKKISIPVIILLQCIKVKDNPWISKKWQGLGVIPVRNITEESTDIILLSNINDEPIYQYNGFKLDLTHDELDSYYQNLISDNASTFIICHKNENNDIKPDPFLVTLSYDEVAIYMETDEVVYNTVIDVKIYPIIERFVLENYQPEKRKKRKLVQGSAGEYYQQLSVYE